MPNTLGIGGDRGFARCPKCSELIDSSSTNCRYCGTSLSASELRVAAEAQRKLTEEKARANNRRALIAGIFSLLGTVIAYAVWFAFKAWGGSRRYPR